MLDYESVRKWTERSELQVPTMWMEQDGWRVRAPSDSCLTLNTNGFLEGNQGGEREEEHQSMPSDCIVEICAIVTVKIAVYSPVGTIIALLDKIDMYFLGP